VPRDHGRILVSIWDDDDFINLTPGAQRLYMLLLSQRGINNAGMLPTQIRKWAKRSAHTSIEDVETALAELIEARFVYVDDETEETLIRSFIRNDGIAKQPNVLKNALRCAEAVESPILRAVLADELRRLGRGDAAAVADRIIPTADTVPSPSGTLSEPFENPSSNPAGRGKGRGETHLLDNSSLKDDTRARAREAAETEAIDAEIAEAINRPGRPVPLDGHKLVRAVIPLSEPGSIRIALAIEANAMLHQAEPISPEDIRAGLELWLSKPELGPKTLPSLVSTIKRQRNKPATNGAYLPPDQRPLTKREQAHIELELMKDNPNPDVLRQFGIDPTTRLKALPGAAAS
jgi:hypothetical protein